MGKLPANPASSAAQAVTLFCIPHAGGSAISYSDFSSHFPDGVQLRPLELPGRGRRCREPLATEMDALVGDLMAGILPVARTAPYALFGHSMGALLAFLCAVCLHALGEPAPAALFLSACPAPTSQGAPFEGSLRHIGHSPDAVWQHAIELGGIPDEILGSPDFRKYLEPILHADFTAMRSCRPRDFAALPVPITVFLGRQDSVSEEDGRDWARLTTREFALHFLEGGHFYLRDQGEALASLITQKLVSRMDMKNSVSDRAGIS